MTPSRAIKKVRENKKNYFTKIIFRFLMNCGKTTIDVSNYFLKKNDFWARLASGRRSTKTGFIVRGSSPE